MSSTNNIRQQDDVAYVRRLADDRDGSAAYDYLFLRYYPRVQYFIERIVKSHETASDLAQEVFMKIWINRECVSRIESFNHYLFRAAKNAALNHLEHLNTIAGYLNMPLEQFDNGCVENELDANDIERSIWNVLKNLPTRTQEIFTLRQSRHLKNIEIARLLNLSENTISNHLKFAIKHIRRSIS